MYRPITERERERHRGGKKDLKFKVNKKIEGQRSIEVCGSCFWQTAGSISPPFGWLCSVCFPFSPLAAPAHPPPPLLSHFEGNSGVRSCVAPRPSPLRPEMRWREVGEVVTGNAQRTTKRRHIRESAWRLWASGFLTRAYPAWHRSTGWWAETASHPTSEESALCFQSGVRSG